MSQERETNCFNVRCLSSRVFFWLRISFIITEALNTIVFLIGFGFPDTQAMASNLDSESGSVRRIFLTLRGVAILGSDVFAGIALKTMKVKYFWASFGFIAMSFTLSVVNSAVITSSLSRLDLDMDIICFVIVLLVIREVYVFDKASECKMQGVKTGHFELRPPPYFAGSSSSYEAFRPPSTSFLQLSPQSLSEVPKLNKYLESHKV